MEINSRNDDESTLVADDSTEQTLLADLDVEVATPCRFLTIPVELRNTIYRYFCMSDVDRNSHARLWAPTGQDGARGGIGYFERDTVLPILLTCRQVHNEAAAVLYGENVFAFHISVLAQGPILFFRWLAPRYIQLLRKVYIRTGYDVDTYGFDPDDQATGGRSRRHPSGVMEWRATRSLTISAELIKQAWPRSYDVQVNREAVLPCSKQDDRGMWSQHEVNNWPMASFHLWRMVVMGVDSKGFRPEFRRVKWIERTAS